MHVVGDLDWGLASFFSPKPSVAMAGHTAPTQKWVPHFLFIFLNISRSRCLIASTSSSIDMICSCLHRRIFHRCSDLFFGEFWIAVFLWLKGVVAICESGDTLRWFTVLVSLIKPSLFLIIFSTKMLLRCFALHCCSPLVLMHPWFLGHDPFIARNGENRPLVTDEPVEFGQ